MMLEVGSDGDIVVQVGVLCGVLGVNSRATISAYVEKGMPYSESGKQKVFGVRKCLEWCYKEGVLKIEFDIGDDVDEEDLPPNVRKDLADARLKELTLKERKEETIDKADVVKDAVAVGLALRDNLMSIPSRLASTLANESDPREARLIMEKEIRQSLEDISSAFME